MSEEEIAAWEQMHEDEEYGRLLQLEEQYQYEEAA